MFFWRGLSSLMSTANSACSDKENIAGSQCIMGGAHHWARMSNSVQWKKEALSNQQIQSPGQKLQNMPMESLVCVLRPGIENRERE